MFGVVARGFHKEPGSMLYAGGRQLGTAKKKKERKKEKKKEKKERRKKNQVKYVPVIKDSSSSCVDCRKSESLRVQPLRYHVTATRLTAVQSRLYDGYSCHTLSKIAEACRQIEFTCHCDFHRISPAL